MDSIFLGSFSRVSTLIRGKSLPRPYSSSSSSLKFRFAFNTRHLRISCSSAPKSNRIIDCYCFPPTSVICILLRLIHNLRVFVSSRTPNHFERGASSRLKRGCSAGSGNLPESAENGEYFQSGGISMALLGSVSPGKVGGGINPFLSTLAANPTFVSGLLAWIIAQSMKMFLNFLVDRKWDFRILFSSGGMPSSHSALCMALTTSVAISHGAADSLFPVCLGFSLIVMYDSIGVRRHAGMHAEILNKIVEDLFQGHPISQRKLKVLLGHTPSQVIGGALLGILVACICCQGFMAAV